MMIVNADDWGGWRSATDAAMEFFVAGLVTSVSAMVFMEDSERAATLAQETGMDVGLHLNFNQTLTGINCSSRMEAAHDRVRRFLRMGKYALILYHPSLRTDFRLVFESQFDEFMRLYGREPSHIDGHQHMHLCSNVLLDGIIPRGAMVRRSFSFWPGEKGFLNRSYRAWVDGRLTRNYETTDYFFALSQASAGRLARILDLAVTSNVELMTHPEVPGDRNALMSEKLCAMLAGLNLGTYRQLATNRRDEVGPMVHP